MPTANGLIKSEKEIEIIAQGGKILREILFATAKKVAPGISTWELNEFAEKMVLEAGGIPSFKGYGNKKNPYPTGLCTSVNEEVVHGIPNKNCILRDGDIIGLDIGMEFQRFFTDTAITVGVGSISEKAKKLIETCGKALNAAIKQAKPGNRIGDMSFAIQKTAEDAGFSVVRELVGHGVGYAVHEEPAIPCFGEKNKGKILKKGMVLAIEPMLCEKDYFLDFDNDGWTIRTKDKGLSAHFEHTIAITDYGERILT